MAYRGATPQSPSLSVTNQAFFETLRDGGKCYTSVHYNVINRNQTFINNPLNKELGIMIPLFSRSFIERILLVLFRKWEIEAKH